MAALRFHSALRLSSGGARWVAQCRHRPPIRQFSTVDVLESTESLIVGIHTTTGLPWCASIPLFAILLRLTVTLPFTYYSTTRANRLVEVSPLIHGWHHRIIRDVRAEEDKAARETGVPVRGEKAFLAEVTRRTKEKRKDVYRKFGCQQWKSYLNLIQLPVWIMASLSLRRMAGIGGLWEHFEPIDSSVEATTTLVDRGASDIDVPEMTLDEALAMVRNPANTLKRDLDPDLINSLSTEGIPGWCPNLLEGDPYVFLPIVFGAAILLNVELQAARRLRPTRFQRYLRNGLRSIAVLIIPMTANSQSLLLLYWTTSACYSLVQNAALNHILPTPEIIQPVKPKALPLSEKFGDLTGGTMKSVVDQLPNLDVKQVTYRKEKPFKRRSAMKTKS